MNFFCCDPVNSTLLSEKKVKSLAKRRLQQRNNDEKSPELLQTIPTMETIKMTVPKNSEQGKDEEIYGGTLLKK